MQTDNGLTKNIEKFKTSSIKKDTVNSYSKDGSTAYEDALNKSFVYGEITTNFIKQITFTDKDKIILDIGCGTGFVFDVLAEDFANRKMQGIGVEPAVGMLEIAKAKYKNNSHFSFHEGSFENLPVSSNSVDKITSTLALHWVHVLDDALIEMRRVLKDNASVDILMIAIDDGLKFKRAIVEALKKHLSFGQIMKTAGLVQRVNKEQLEASFKKHFHNFDVDVKNPKDVIYGTFAEHMKWWKARSTTVIADVKDKTTFMQDLETEMNKISTPRGIPFDSSCFWIKLRGRG